MAFDSFPKIFTFGQRHIDSIFDSEVEVTEKIDGSQFSFLLTGEGELKFRSKGRVFEVPDKMFELAVARVEAIKDKLPTDIQFYGEYLNKPRHNVLEYSRTPTNNVCIFGAYDYVPQQMVPPMFCKEWAEVLGFEYVPVLYQGMIKSADELRDIMDKESYLGGPKMEGVVVKNYNKELLVGGQVLPIMCAKYVSEAFKEVHRSDWKGNHTARGGWEEFIKGYQTEARWQKSIQHLKENGVLTDSPKDIGPLIKEIHKDIVEEEKENIKNALWRLFSNDLIRTSTNGFPEWYKNKLLESAFENEGLNRESSEHILSSGTSS